MSKEQTLVTALEGIWSASKKSKLSGEFFNKAEKELDYVCEKLKISPIQAIIIAVILDAGRALTMKEVAEHAGVSLIRMMVSEEEFDKLHERWMLGWEVDRNGHGSSLHYSIRPMLADAIRKDEPFEARDLASYTEYDVLDQLHKWVGVMQYEERMFTRVMDSIKQFITKTNHVHLSLRLSQYELNNKELAMLLVAIVALVKNKQESIDSSDYDFLLKGGLGGHQLVDDINRGESYLNELNLLENANNDGLAETDIFALTETARTVLLQGINFKHVKSHTVAFARELDPEKIVKKELFYNSKEKVQVGRLSTLLTPENFANVQQRMVDAGMRSGFACMLYGSPGTGKTETVYQICKQTGRKLFQVDISAIKSKWVGDSEKHIQAVFDQYADVVKNEAVCPVLLFNEADAIFTKRNERVQGSADQMMNSMQNIILQAMETFSGILICTTNLNTNLDKAFERRFLFKIRFMKPGVEVKQNIWQAMMPSLDASAYAQLAKTYDFSGGEIENVVRKQTIDTILYGTEASFASVCGLCEEERVAESRTQIGFSS